MKGLGKDFASEEKNEFFMQESNTITDQDNHIYFYCPVTTNTCLNLIIMIRMIVQKKKFRNIFIHIHSPGGSLLPALGVVDTIKNTKLKIITIIEGYAASAATLIAAAGHIRLIHPHSLMMIHQLSSQINGKLSDMLSHINDLELFMNVASKIYLEKATIDKQKLQQLLKKDSWLTADDALNYGLVDSLTPYSKL